ncbi:hypothetical protein XO10_01460 [Marinitoga sp. 1135]|uniref:Wadjet protein JetD C-terminal domain-containing protein n=1 Tax=Marinitoga piezophila (strain DSM 14283 / JCM 11233 / KA3) TaxID=443254 RepID=H2J3M9_MARPK|nr:MULTISPECIES: Wadjet anti-phage system protein JetD domain-containing protein [Marinitoga]AEX84673.1 hypothetical protein Marpi_0221 [Marinitoga piezophila KA3]APT75197.1 hypothetical protein LN42_01405 [Marinitoga sp. 1137]NUU94985.1 hypothetical protein [Marinitoga sp. 1135]NUU96941.1 hypothetical protein [Marinitoga sp. 1138]
MWNGENMNLKKYLESYKKKYITYEELEKISNNEYEEIYKKITNLMNKGILIPVKNKKENGRYPSLPAKYRININNKKDELFLLHPKINIDYYLNHINEYQKDREIILKIDNYLKNGDKKYVAMRERAYEIFDNEKAFERDREVLNVLRNIKINIKEDLYTFDSREPFYIFAFNNNIKKVLISENQTPFYNFYLLHQEGINPFDAVIFGEGKKILRSFEFIYEYVPVNTIFYYWGDIDYDGIFILNKLIERYNKHHIIPWEKGYKAMLNQKSKKSKERKFSIKSENNLIKELLNIIREGKNIPQEAINYQLLKKLVSESV